MWPFSKSDSKRLHDLEQTVDRLESRLKSIEGEWEATYQKLHALRVSLHRKIQASEQATLPQEPRTEERKDFTPLAPGSFFGRRA